MTTQTEVQPLSIPDAQPRYPTADDIIAAFRKHRIQPTREVFLAGGANACGCALGALAFDREGVNATYTYGNRAGGHMGLPYGWLVGLEFGFEGWPPMAAERHAIGFREGWTVGRAVARWAFGERA